MALTKDALADSLPVHAAGDRGGSVICPGVTHRSANRFRTSTPPELSVAFYKRSLALEPSLTAGHSDLAVSYLLLNRHADARRELAAAAHRRRGRALTRRRSTSTSARYADADQSLACRGCASRRLGLRGHVRRCAAPAPARHRDELAEATELASGFPRTASRANAGRAAAGAGRCCGGAAELSDALLRDAASDSATPAALRCGARAAAAMKQTAQLAAILDRIASREDRLRYWAKGINGETGSASR